MKLTIHRGTKEIGGTCIELQTQSNRLIMDVGLPLVDRQGNRLDSWKFKDFTISQLKEQEIAPDIHALYQNAPNLPDGLLLSHAHLDHYGLLPHIHPSIPIYCSKGTKIIMEIAHFFRQNNFEPKSVKTVDPWKEFQIGQFRIIPYLADHSAIDAFSFLIEAEGKRIFYTGDLRSHGRKGILFDNLLKNPPKDIDYLIMEGSTLGREDDVYTNEEDVEDALVKHFSEQRLYVASFSSQNIDRFVSVFRACMKTNRTVVIDPYTAYILNSLKELSPYLPQYNWEKNIKIFFVPNSYTDKLAESKELYEFASAKISLDEIIENKEKLVLKDNYKLSRISTVPL